MAKAARASVHLLGDITHSLPVTWTNGGSRIVELGLPEERVLFRLGRDQPVVLRIDPVSDAQLPVAEANMQASVWSKEGTLMGTLEGRPLRLSGTLGAGDYQPRVRPIGAHANSPYRLSVKPAEVAPRPKAWGLVGLAAVVISLRMLSGSRTYRAQGLGGVRIRD